MAAVWKKELRLGALKSRRATPLLSFPDFRLDVCLDGGEGAGGRGGNEADFVNHEHKSLLLPLRSSPSPPPPPPLPECLGLSGLLCTQIVLVRWEFIMWCGGRDQCSPVQLTGCARPTQAEGGKKSTLGAKHHYKPNLNHPHQPFEFCFKIILHVFFCNRQLLTDALALCVTSALTLMTNRRPVRSAPKSAANGGRA